MSDKSEITKVPKENNLVDEIPGVLPILPLRDIVIFPYMIFPVLVGREQSINAANFAVDNTKYIFLSTQKKSSIEDPSSADIYPEGTIAKIVQILKLPNGCLLYTSPSPRDRTRSRMPSSAWKKKTTHT